MGALLYLEMDQSKKVIRMECPNLKWRNIDFCLKQIQEIKETLGKSMSRRKTVLDDNACNSAVKPNADGPNDGQR